MRITRVELAVPEPAATARWYADVLGLPVTGTTVAVGTSALVLVAGDPAGHHHLAFGVPADAIAGALDWLTGRVELLTPDGAGPLVPGSPDWDSESVYFRGPDGAVLEVIARHRRPERLTGPFGTAALLELSEVGLPVADVPAALATLAGALGLPPFGEHGPRFAPVGDDDGLLILVPPDRVWFPTVDELPGTGPVTVQVAAARPGRLRLADLVVVRSETGD